MGIVPRKFFCEECKKMRWPGDCGHGRMVSQLKSLSADELTMMVSDRRRCGCDTRAGTVCSCRGPKGKTPLIPVAAHPLKDALEHYITTGGKMLYHDETRPGWVISAHFAVYVGEEVAARATKERCLLRVVARATTTHAMNDLDRYGRGETLRWNCVKVSGDDGPVEMVGFRTGEERRRGIQYPTILAKPYAALLTGVQVICRARDGDILGPVSGWDYDKLVAVVMPRRGETIV